MKFREMAGGYAEVYLPVLMRGEVTRENFGALETAVQMVEGGNVNYPVNAGHLRSTLETARKSLLPIKE